MEVGYISLQTNDEGDIGLLIDPLTLGWDYRLVLTRESAFQLAERILEILAEHQEIPVSEMDS